MEGNCKRHTELPHSSKLFCDLLYRFERVREFYRSSPTDATSFGAAAGEVAYPDERRRALISVLRRQNGDHPLLEQLAQPGTVAVLTGQQVGLFSGPSYTIYKALTAIRLAEQLSAQGIRAVPVFWLATEDHDFAEVSTCWTFDATHRPVALRVAAPDGHTDHPVGGVVLPDPPIEGLAATLAGFPFGDDVLQAVREAYRPGRTMGEAFGALLKRLLGRQQMLFFDPMDRGAREIAAPVVRAALESAGELTAALLERNKRLNDAGYHAQVHVENHTSLVFLLEDGHRINLRRHNGEYAAKERRFSTAELSERAADLSPNALLRPVVQDYLFPTVAYIGGPAELAYLGQSQVLYERLLGRQPVAVSRAGFTLFDARCQKLMDRYGIVLEDFYHGEDALREKIGEKLIPPQVSEALRQSSEGISQHLNALEIAFRHFDSTLQAALEKSRAKIKHQFVKIERKAGREQMRRNQRASEEASYLFQSIYPHKHLQERFYTILPFLAQHGLDLVERLYENVRLECPDHLLIKL